MPAVGTFGHRWYPEDLALGAGVFGDVFYVDYLNGTDSDNAGRSSDKPLKTLGKAHELATSNHGDVIFVNGTTGEHVKEDGMLTWSKNRISVFGVGPAGAADPQPEIQLSATGNAAANAATLKVTGYGNTFTNLYISNAGTEGTSVAALWDAGENNVFNNCQFAKFSDLDETGVSDVEARGDTTTWRNCKFGVTWVVQEVARPTLLIKGTGGSARMKSNYFENCYFVCANDDNTKRFISVYDNNSLAYENVWVNPVFLNAVMTSQSTVAMLSVVDSSAALAEGTMLFVNPAFNATLFCDSDIAANDGVQVVGPQSAVDAGEPQTPTNT